MADEEKEGESDLSAVEIPDLKKKQEKERKKAGAAWGSSKPAGSWQGAVGGNGAAGARGALGAAGGNAGGAAANVMGGAGRGFFGAVRGLFQGGGGVGGFFSRLAQQFSAVMARVTATAAGKMAVAAAVAVAVGIAAIMAAKLLGGGAGGAGGPDLAGLRSSIQIDRGGKSGLDYTKAGRDTRLAQPVEKTKEAPKTEETAQKAEEAPPAEGDGMGVQEGVAGTQEGEPRDRMAHDLSGSKLSSGLGGGFQNTPFANVSAPKFPGLQKNKPLGFGKGDGRRGTGGRLMARNINANRNMNLRGLRSSRAIGQLRGMGSQVGSIMQKAGETSAAEATTQFEGTENSGGTAPTGPGSGPTGVEGGGGTEGGGGPGVPETPTLNVNACTASGGTWDAENGVCTSPVSQMNITAWQQKVAEGKSKLERIKSLLDEIAMLWLLVAILAPLCLLPFCSGGACAMAAMAVTLYKIYEKCRKVHDLGGELKQLGDEINAMEGGKPQGDIFKDFGNQAQDAAIVAGTVPILGAVIYGQILDSAIEEITTVEEKLADQGEQQAQAQADWEQRYAENREQYGDPGAQP